MTSRSSAPKASSNGGGGGRAKTNTHGYDYAEVKAFAIANGLKAANGNPVTESTPRLGQSIYDAFHEAQQKK